MGGNSIDNRDKRLAAQTNQLRAAGLQSQKKKKGKVRQWASGIGQGVNSRINPWSEGRKDRKAGKKLDGEERVEKIREKRKSEKEAGEQQDKEKAGVTDEIHGEDLKIFNDELEAALILGQRRTGEKRSSEMDFIDVIRDEKFLQAMAKRRILTPLEADNTDYADGIMRKRREELVQAIREKSLTDLREDDLDIIYTTALGDDRLWNENTWYKDKPTPSEAFFAFLENTALGRQPHERGTFIGHVLCDLKQTTSFTSPEVTARKPLIDSQIVDEYIDETVGKQIRETISDFKGHVLEILITPTSEMCLGAPGFGLSKIEDEAVAAKEAEEAKAWQEVEQARSEEDRKAVEITRALESAARSEYNKVSDMVRDIRLEVEAGKRMLSEQEEMEILEIERKHAAEMTKAEYARRVAEAVLEAKGKRAALENNVKKDLAAVEDAVSAEGEVKEYHDKVASNVQRLKGLRRKRKKDVAKTVIQEAKKEKKETSKAMRTAKNQKSRAENSLEVSQDQLTYVLENEDRFLRERMHLVGENDATKAREEAEKKHARAEEEYWGVKGEKEEAEKICETFKTLFEKELQNCKTPATPGTSLSNIILGEENLKWKWENPAVAEWLNDVEQLREKRERLPDLARPELKKIIGKIEQILDERDRIAKLTHVEGGTNIFKGQVAAHLEMVTSLQEEVQKSQPLPDTTKISINELLEVLKGLGASKNLGVSFFKEKEKEDAMLRDALGIREVLENDIQRIIKVDAMAGFNEEVDRFKEKVDNPADVERAELPDEVRDQIKKLADILKIGENLPADGDVGGRMEKIRGLYAQPIKKVAELTIKEFEASTIRQMGRIPNTDRLIVRNMWIESKKRRGTLPMKPEGRLKRLGNWTMHYLEPKTWWKGIKKIWDKSEGVREDLRKSNIADPVIIRDTKTGEKYESLWMRRGIKAVLAVYSTMWLFSLPAGCVRGCQSVEPRSDGMVANLFNRWNQSWDPPWYVAWLNFRAAPWFAWDLGLYGTPYIEHAPAKRIIKDSYDIVDRLAQRGHEYYRSAFGLGNMLSHESDKDGAEERLDWIQGKSDVLMYCQERRTLRKYVGMRNLARTSDRCSEKEVRKKKGEKEIKETIAVKEVPKSCEALGLDTREKIEAYGLVEDEEGWRKGEEVPWEKKDIVCCLVDVETDPIHDKMKLNRLETDRFIATLMALGRGGLELEDVDRQLGNRTELTLDDLPALGIENLADADLEKINKLLGERRTGSEEAREGATERLEEVLEKIGESIEPKEITYGYLVDSKNRSVWIAERFLIPEDEDKIVDEYPMRKRESIDLIVTHGKTLGPLLKPLLKKGEIDRHLAAEHSDEFMTLLAERIIEEDGTEGLNPSTDNVSPEALTAAFEKAKTVAESRKLVTDCTVEHQEMQLRKKLKQLIPPAVELTIDDGVVHIVQTHEDIRELMLKFTGPGSTYALHPHRAYDFAQLLWSHKKRGGDVSDYDPFDGGKRAKWAIRRGYIISKGEWLRLNEQAKKEKEGEKEEAKPKKEISEKKVKRFYSRNTKLDNLLSYVISKLDEDAQKVEGHIRKEIYRLLTSKDAADKVRREEWGITVTRGKVKLEDAKKAREGLSVYVKGFVAKGSLSGEGSP